jgi:hypothetical protein
VVKALGLHSKGAGGSGHVTGVGINFTFFLVVNPFLQSLLNPNHFSEFGSLNISEVNVVGVSEAYKTNIKDENTVFKGVKAHFHTDSYGIVRVERAELLVEEKEQPSNSTFSSRKKKLITIKFTI